MLTQIPAKGRKGGDSPIPPTAQYTKESPLSTVENTRAENPRPVQINFEITHQVSSDLRPPRRSTTQTACVYASAASGRRSNFKVELL
jgi:hypothetical protein